MISKQSIARARLRLKGRLRTLTIAGIVVFLLSWVPNVPFWLHVVKQACIPFYHFAATTLGRITLLLCSIILILADQLRLNRKAKGYNPATLRGRTLQLRDEIQAFLTNAPPRVSPRSQDESREDYLLRASQTDGRRFDYLVNGYGWRFHDRVQVVHFQFGECGVLDGRLNDILCRPTKTDECYEEILAGLTRLSEHPEGATNFPD